MKTKPTISNCRILKMKYSKVSISFLTGRVKGNIEFIEEGRRKLNTRA